jgi:small neutral amino acid transporter SnatA (MarC family)
MTAVRILWVIMALLFLTGLIVLSMWGIPAPSIRVEKIIPNDKLPQ